jgi:hypothetical protein
MKKYFILIGAEVLAGAISFFLVIAAIVLFSHDVAEFLFDLKARLIGFALLIPFIKLMALKKMPRDLMALYKTSDMLLTAEFSESSVTCVEFSKRVATDELSDDLFL